MVFLRVYNEARTEANPIASESVPSPASLESDKQEQRVEDHCVHPIQSGASAGQHHLVVGDHPVDRGHVDDAGVQRPVLPLLPPLSNSALFSSALH